MVRVRAERAAIAFATFSIYVQSSYWICILQAHKYSAQVELQFPAAFLANLYLIQIWDLLKCRDSDKRAGVLIKICVEWMQH